MTHLVLRPFSQFMISAVVCLSAAFAEETASSSAWTNSQLGELTLVVKYLWLGTTNDIPPSLRELKLSPEQTEKVKDLLSKYHKERMKLILVPNPTEPTRLLQVGFWNEVDKLLTDSQKQQVRLLVFDLLEQNMATMLTTEPALEQELKISPEQSARLKTIYDALNKQLTVIAKEDPDGGKKYGAVGANPTAQKKLEDLRLAYKKKRKTAIEAANTKINGLFTAEQKIVWRSLSTRE